MPKGWIHSYRVVLANGETRPDDKASDANVHDGALMLLNNDVTVVIFAAGTWARCEHVERKDEK